MNDVKKFVGQLLAALDRDEKLCRLELKRAEKGANENYEIAMDGLLSGIQYAQDIVHTELTTFMKEAP